jgi:hypothetical protein
MGITYHPVIFHTYDLREGTVKGAQMGVDRFEKLNGIRPQLVTRESMNAAGIETQNGYWYPFWLWDVVPESAEYVLFIDSVLLPIRPLPEIPECKFAAAPDRWDRIEQAKEHSAIVRMSGKYHQMQLFVVHRDTRPAFEEGKKLDGAEKHMANDGLGDDGRCYQIALYDLIRAHFPVHELTKEWNWIATYEKEFYTNEPIMLHTGGQGTWAYFCYIHYLCERMEAAGINP